MAIVTIEIIRARLYDIMIRAKAEGAKMQEERQPTFEIYEGEDEEQKFRWRLIAPNGEIIASGEGYLTFQKCEDGISDVKRYAPVAPVVQV
jgi:uncharacterized protein